MDGATPVQRRDEADAEVWRTLGALRLAFFTPVREYPPLADKKAVILLAAESLMVSVLLAFSHTLTELMSAGSAPVAALTAAVLTALGVFVVLGVWFAFESLHVPVPPMPDSLAFFPHICQRTREEYRRQVLGLDYDQALGAMLHYNYSYAVLSVRKFRLVNRAVACVRAAFGLWIVLLVLIATAGA